MRGAWAYENFLPYVMVGVSVARVDSIQTVFAHYVGTATTTTTTSGFPPVTGPPVPVDRTYLANPSMTGKYRFGFSAGLGLDYALTRNFFLRGEIEYLQLGVPSNLTMNTMSARAGGGLKF
jgi:opacity protein-like surface antigen